MLRYRSSFDERPLARQVAQRFATDHHEDVLVPDVVGLLPGVVDALDEPFAVLRDPDLCRGVSPPGT